MPDPSEGPGSLLGAMWHYRWMTLTIVVVTTVLSLAVGLATAGPVQAVGTIALKTPPANNVLAPGAQGDASLARYTAQRARYLTSDAVIEEVAKSQKGASAAALRSRIVATPSGDANLVTVTTTGATPAEAVALGRAVIAAYRQSTQRQIAGLTAAAIASIDQSSGELRLSGRSDQSTSSQLAIQASELKTNSALLGDGVDFVEEPREDGVAIPGLPYKEIGLGVVIGLALAAVASWVRADREVARRAD